MIFKWFFFRWAKNTNTLTCRSKFAILFRVRGVSKSWQTCRPPPWLKPQLDPHLTARGKKKNRQIATIGDSVHRNCTMQQYTFQLQSFNEFFPLILGKSTIWFAKQISTTIPMSKNSVSISAIIWWKSVGVSCPHPKFNMEVSFSIWKY